MKKEEITSMNDIRLLLKRFGTFIYSGDPVADLELMEDEIKDLYEAKLLEPHDFQLALLYIKKEKRKYETNDGY